MNWNWIHTITTPNNCSRFGDEGASTTCKAAGSVSSGLASDSEAWNSASTTTADSASADLVRRGNVGREEEEDSLCEEEEEERDRKLTLLEGVWRFCEILQWVANKEHKERVAEAAIVLIWEEKLKATTSELFTHSAMDLSYPLAETKYVFGGRKSISAQQFALHTLHLQTLKFNFTLWKEFERSKK